MRRLHELSGEDVVSCFQCGKCTSSCPMTEAMDLMPNQLIRFCQLGQDEVALHSRTVYVCASCLQCEARCPKNISIARVAEAVRTYAAGEGLEHYGPDAVSLEVLRAAPQQALVSAFRKFAH